MVDSTAKFSHPPGSHVAVLLALPLPTAYDYRVPGQMVLSDGDFVRVPFGRRQVNGVVWGAGQHNIDESKIRDVEECLSTPPMSKVLRSFVEWVATYTFSFPGAVLKMTLPAPFFPFTS